jgi:RNA polymerase sigma-70 factor (ECF subfamily)
MVTESRGEVDRLLAEAAGNEAAKGELIERVYTELYELALRAMRWERRDHSWGATDLVHEVYLKLFKGEAPTKDRALFFWLAGRAMRKLLKERALARARKPHDHRVPLDDVLDELERSQRVNVEDLDRALADLEAFAPREHEVVMLRIFGGLKVAQVADHLGVSVPTVEKDWKWARTWLYTRLRENFHDARALAP